MVWWTVVLWVLSFVAAVRVAYKDLLSVCDCKVKASVSIDTDGRHCATWACLTTTSWVSGPGEATLVSKVV